MPRVIYPSFDLFSDPPPPTITPFQQQYVRNFDWKSSLLGPVERWTPQLRQMVMIVQRDNNPSCLYWDIPGGSDGKKDVVIVYNESYTHLIGQKHPDLQGTNPKYGFAEIWDQFAALLEAGRQNGNTVEDKNALLLLQRHGFLEETYFSWKFIPVVGLEGYVVGSYATVVEVTQEVLVTRRLASIQRLGQLIASSRDASDLWSRVLTGLEENDRDVPLALVYSVMDLDSLSLSSASISRASHCKLEGALGVQRNHEIAPSLVDLSGNGSTRWALAFRKAIEGGGTYLVLSTEDGSLPAGSLDGINWRGFGIPSRRIVVCPIRSSTSTAILGFLVVALNPRRPFDQEYKNWFEHLMTSMAAPRVEAILAAQDSAKLSEQLELRTKDLQESEKRFLRFATRSTVAIIIVKPNGELAFGNSSWFDLVEGAASSRDEWITAVLEEDRPLCNSMWKRMIYEKIPVNYQCRFTKPWKSSQPLADGSSDNHTSVLVSGWPDLDLDGNVTSVMATVTDISEIKHIEEQLRHQTRDAELRVKQQEAFVDMVSHEIRNPLSAILHCADEISASLVRQISQSSSTFGPEELHSLVEAADTIAYCAIHQKRIVDDILTLSKLDANLLDVSPLPVDPVDLVETALKIFGTEMKRLKMQLQLVVDHSLKDLNIHWLLFDSSRLLQVLINLMTNAVKFTRDSPNLRRITVRMVASTMAPPDNNRGINYVPCMDKDCSHSVGAHWPPEDTVYLSISVEDTGKGLSGDEMKMLFRRFSQASPKTQEKYGGSGLGLYISRQLSEMQGGQIGVKSEVGCGTTFVFYIKTCRTMKPENPNADILAPQLSRVQEELQNGYGSGVGTFHTDESLATHDGEKLSKDSGAFSPTRYENHILIVEDNVVNQKVLAKQLRKHNWTVSVANHGEEALAFLKETNFWTGNPLGSRLSIVLMDLEMPVMDGLTCVRRIREFQRLDLITGHVPVIAVTANARSQQMRIATDAGMDDVLTKPYRISEILAKISNVTERLTGSSI